jgi:preprotein translocase subunit SecY
MSILIFSSIISSFPGQLVSIFTIDGTLKFLLVVLVIGATIVGIVFVEQAQRRIPVQYAKRQVGRKSYGGTSTYLPIKVNQAGIIPVIFASSLLYIPSLIVQLTGSQAAWAQWVATYMDPGRAGYLTLNFLLIMFFAYFYVSITFNPEETADNMKQYGGFIPGIRAGKPTADYLAYVLNRITLPGALYLATIATLPYLAFEALGVGTRFAFGGTSILIIVGVGLDTVKQIESQLQQRNYEGFLK